MEIIGGALKIHLITVAPLCKKSIRDARTPQPGEIIFNTNIEVVKEYKDWDTFRAVI